MEKDEKKKLSEIFATVICGNDILSSALYVSGIAVLFVGIYAPLIFLFIVLVLFFYKSVYREVVEALPINGGAYNCLLNSTSKTAAAVAGVVTIVSYVATAVISAKIAVEYVSSLFHFPVIPLTIALLFIFALLVISGIKSSSKVAFIIFEIHVIVLSMFLVLGLSFFLHGSSHFLENLTYTTSHITSKGLFQALFFGFSACLLGISGFESSADFVEEQRHGVFKKTLRNMLLGIAIFNPLIALVILNATPIEFIISSKEFVLANVAVVLGGQLFQYIMVFDAFLVLSGAVLTAYIAVSGLVSRMASDACLPGGLLRRNKHKAYPRIVFTFFILCTSILLITRGNFLSLAGVYTIAFLSTMTLFALGNIILRETRTELKRRYKAPILFVVFALLATTIGILGNINMNPQNVVYFALYFIPTVTIVLLIVYQDYNIAVLLHFTRHIPFLHKYLQEQFEDITAGTLVAFIHHVSKLHTILRYIDRNETSQNIILVHCNGITHVCGKSCQEIKEILPHLKKAGVFPYFNIKFVFRDMEFGPQAINEISKEFKVRKNRILIGSIHDFHNFDYGELGGVRIIF